MILFDILYNIIIYPVEFIIEIVFYLFNNVFKSGYATSLFFLSLIINFISLPLYNIAESWQAKERAIQEKMKPMIDNIKAVYKGDQRYLLIRTCQRINGYKTIYAFRGTLGLLIQIPFFLAAYNFIHNLSGLQLGSFLFIKDFSKPDGILNIGNISVNILPFIMTLFSLLAGLVYSKKLRFKESLPLYIVSLIFLVLLYNSPSGLVFYWTLNCLFSLIKNIVIEYKLYKVFVVNKYKILRGYNIFFVILTIIFLLLISLSKIDRKGYVDIIDYVYNIDDNYVYNAKFIPYSKIFKQSDLFVLKIRKEKIPDYVVNINYSSFVNIINSIELNDSIENIGKIELYYSLNIRETLINIYLAFLFIFILVNLSGIENFILKYNSKTNEEFIKIRNQLFLISALSISALAGFFIISSIIINSVNEFNNPSYLLINNLSICLGIFLFYPLFIYILFSDKIKNIISLTTIFILPIVLINTFIMTGNYININSNFIFDNTNLLIASTKEIIINIFLIFISLIIVFILIKKKYLSVLCNIYLIIFLVIISISIFNTTQIFKDYNKIKLTRKNIDNSVYNDKKIFNLSKNGENVFVFISDMAVSSYWYDAFERFPNYKKDFDGFVYYPNTVSYSEHTTSIASLHGGYDYLPYEMSIDGNYNITNFHNEALLMIPLSLQKYGYSSSILDPAYLNFSAYSDFEIFKKYTNVNAYDSSFIYQESINNYFGNNIKLDLNDLELLEQKKLSVRFSIFRMLPINLRHSFYNNGEWFNISSLNINEGINHYALLNYTTNTIFINSNGNYYNIFHNGITHHANFFGNDYLPHNISSIKVSKEDMDIYGSEHDAKYFYVSISALNSFNNILNFLKNNDIYDNTKIIIVSDHATPVDSSLFTNKNLDFARGINALLMFKDFNVRGELKTDTNFMTIADTPYLATKHIPNIKNPFNNKLITNDYKTNGANIILFNSWYIQNQKYNRYDFDILYNVKNNIFDINNWKKFVVDWKTKETKEIELK